ncbi:MAG: hypothetical protein M3Y69_05040, partial [Verrucomicrobiota bacterium]|nr:hypothetical protein [Verrucomicrobiota bacterium]
MRIVPLLSLLLLLRGCGSGKNTAEQVSARAAKRLDREAEKAKVARAGNWGHYNGPIDTRWENDGI